jgi:hypothetical protein
MFPVAAKQKYRSYLQLRYPRCDFDDYPLTPELNPSAQRCQPRFLLGILIFKGLTGLHLYESFGVKGLIEICKFIV